jgi:hypothetical protein
MLVPDSVILSSDELGFAFWLRCMPFPCRPYLALNLLKMLVYIRSALLISFFTFSDEFRRERIYNIQLSKQIEVGAFTIIYYFSIYLYLLQSIKVEELKPNHVIHSHVHVSTKTLIQE